MNVHHDFRYVSRAELLALAEADGLPPLWPGAVPTAAAAAAAGGDAHHHRSTAAGPRAEARTETVERQLEDTSLRVETGASGSSEVREIGRELLLQRPAGQGRSGGRAGDGEGGCGGGEAKWWARFSSRESACHQRHALGATHAFGPNLHGKVASEASWAAELRALQGGATHVASSREARKLLAGDSGSGSSDGGARSQQQQLLKGLRLWQAALSPYEPLGSLIRSRPLAALVDAGGCRILAVHAGAFPWMLDAVDALVSGRDPWNAAAGHGPVLAAPSLRPLQYVEAWNAAVSAALSGCEGRGCSHRAAAGAQGMRAGGGGDDVLDGADPYERYRLALADLLLGGDGAVWSRRYDQADARQVCAEVAELLRRLDVQSVVVGHTVQPGGRVSSRCGGQLLMADVGLSRAISGSMAVLQCEAGHLRAVYGSVTRDHR